jgi:hypothetical protein
MPPAPPKPTYSLIAIQADVAVRGVSCFTHSALKGLADMGLTTAAIGVIATIKPAHFYKTMPSKQNARFFQDVYRVPTLAGPAYVKFTHAGGHVAIVVSFKEL